MTFLAPGFFLAALGIAAATVALHLIVTRQPRAGVLPTARFVPDMPATATARAARPSDLLLLLLRVLLVLAAGAGLARPVFKPSRGAEARVILLDVSRSVRDAAAIRDSVRGLYRPHDALIFFDSSARQVTTGVADSLSALHPSTTRGNISGALIAAMRAASGLRDYADSIELVIVSPFASEELDASTRAVRQLWPGKARMVRMEQAPESPSRAGVLDVKVAADDPIRVSSARVHAVSGVGALLVRDDTSAVDPSAVTGAGRALVTWPIASRPRAAVERAVRDTIGGVLADSALVVATFERRWRYPADSIKDVEVIARWIDGEPAAIEWPASTGCIRSVAVPVSPIGDLVIRDDFIRFVGALSSGCVARESVRPAGVEALNDLAGAGGLARREAFRPRTDVRSALAPWLLALALVAAIAELFVRRRKRDSSAVRSFVRRDRAA